MYRLLIVASRHELAGNAEPAALAQQVDFLKALGVLVDLIFDPDQNSLERQLLKTIYDAVYATTMWSYETSDGATHARPFNIYRLLMHFEQPVVGSDLFAQLLVNDKTLCAQRTGIAPRGCLVTKDMSEEDILKVTLASMPEASYPVLVKPNNLSCSLGLSRNSIAHHSYEIPERVAALFRRFSDLTEVRIECYVEKGNEYTVSVVGNGASLCCSVTSIATQHRAGVFNDEFQKKLCSNERRRRYHLVADAQLQRNLIFHATQVFQHLGLRDFARLDFMHDTRAYLIDVNALPVLGNAFSWEWQKTLSVESDQLILLPLVAFHYRQLASGRPDPLPPKVLDRVPAAIRTVLSTTSKGITVPESTPPNDHCRNTALYSMSDRVGTEIEVATFVGALARVLKPRLVIETGTYLGTTALAIGRGLLGTPGCLLVTLEKNMEICESIRRKLANLPVEVICGDSLQYTPSAPIDLLFLDSHRPARALEFAHFRPYLSRSAVIVWHDSAPEHQQVYRDIEALYDANVLDRILLPTPRGLTISMLRTWTQNH